MPTSKERLGRDIDGIQQFRRRAAAKKDVDDVQRSTEAPVRNKSDSLRDVATTDGAQRDIQANKSDSPPGDVARGILKTLDLQKEQTCRTVVVFETIL